VRCGEVDYYIDVEQILRRQPNGAFVDVSVDGPDLMAALACDLGDQ